MLIHRLYPGTPLASLLSSRNALSGAPCLQELPANNFPQYAVLPISTFHVGPDQSDSRSNPNPNPNPNPLGGSRSTGADARLRRVFWWRFSKKARAAEKPVSINQTSDLQEVIGR